jgi:hypothetical protein
MEKWSSGSTSHSSQRTTSQANLHGIQIERQDVQEAECCAGQFWDSIFILFQFVFHIFIKNN